MNDKKDSNEQIFSNALSNIKDTIETSSTDYINQNILELKEVFTHATKNTSNSPALDKTDNQTLNSVISDLKLEHKIEQIASDILKTELKKWLNENLAGMVKEIIRKEIAKLIEGNNK